MAIYMNRSPGIMAKKPAPGEASALLDTAQHISDGSARAEATIATAAAFGGHNRDPAVLELSRHAVALSHQVEDRTTECAALDQLCAVFQELDEIPEAAAVVERRLELISTLPIDAGSGFEFTDTFLMASDVRLASGDLRGRATTPTVSPICRSTATMSTLASPAG